MIQKNRYQSISFYVVIILSAIGFTSCHHKIKESDQQNLITEMPLPNPNKNYYSPESYEKEVLVDNETIYQVIEQMPQFPGGDKELMYIISKRLKYPINASRYGIRGKVILRFVVTRTGSIANPEVVRSLDPYCDKEALRVLKTLPRFIPGKQNGVNVNVYYTLPVEFRLK
ncbi:MAG: energy transducer TonB [Paludibacter sp.]|nr:energy transducer TonB [Paludibacter sp.]